MDASAAAPHLTASDVAMDVQCFRDNSNEFVLKEVCIVDVETGTILLHRIALPPFVETQLNEDKRRQSRWVAKHYHGIDWGFGNVAYDTLLEQVQLCLKDRPAVYVKGLEKRRYVENHLLINPLTQVLDAGDLGCVSLRCTPHNSLRCNQHKSVNHHCALHNAAVLRHWLRGGGRSTAPPPQFCKYRL